VRLIQKNFKRRCVVDPKTFHSGVTFQKKLKRRCAVGLIRKIFKTPLCGWSKKFSQPGHTPKKFKAPLRG
jgi:hypothetical protein